MTLSSDVSAAATIAYLNAHGPGALPAPPSGRPPPYVDCNGDGELRPIDILLVIDDLNTHGPHSVAGPSGDACAAFPVCQAEGEAADFDAALTQLLSGTSW